MQKLNLTVCDIMAFFSSTANGKNAVKSTETAEWQEKIMAFLQGTIDQYNGGELIGMAANVLHKVFFSFPPSSKVFMSSLFINCSNNCQSIYFVVQC